MMSREWAQCLFGFWVNAFCKLQRHAFGAKFVKGHDLRGPNMYAYPEFGTLPMAEFWYHGR